MAKKNPASGRARKASAAKKAKGDIAKPRRPKKDSLTAKQAGRKNSRIEDGWAGCFTGITLTKGGWKCVKCFCTNTKEANNCAACEAVRPGQHPPTNSTSSDGAGALTQTATGITAAGFVFAAAAASTESSGSGDGGTAAGFVFPGAPAASSTGPNGGAFGGTATLPEASASDSGGRPGVSGSSLDLPKIREAPQEIDNLGWKSIHIIGEQVHTGSIENIHGGSGTGEEWDFSHLGEVSRDTLAENGDCDLYLFGGSPTPVDFDSDKSSAVSGVRSVPTVCAIVVKRGHVPPEYVSIRDYQRGGERIVPFQAQRLSWQPYPGSNRVFRLQCRLRSCAMKNKSEHSLYSHEYSSLFTMKPSVDWSLDKFGKLSVKHAIFEYSPPNMLDNDSPLSEEFDKECDKLADFIPDFLERHELGANHYDGVKEAIQRAFDNARREKQAKVDLLDSKYDREVLEEIKVVKIYPRNTFLNEQHKLPIVNEYYRHASIKVV